MKKLFITAAFAVLAASPAFAATQGQHARNAAAAYDSYAFAAPRSDVVVSDGKILGADPDPFIRQQLLREGDPAYTSK